MNPNDPAFPVKAFRVVIPKPLMTAKLAIGMKEIEETIPGLTKREYFAAVALQALLGEQEYHKWSRKQYAIEAVACADALIAELSK